jgi:phosphoglycerol transferase MdoB-like AlkP superfamily enzyme
MPNFRRLMAQCGGHLMVSVKGGNTANTEYEFLTGDSMAFLPAGSVVFQQFIRDNIPALPSYLASLGYDTTGIHPYLATGWDRKKVYPLLGFEEFLTKDDFANAKILREWISDEAAFDKIEQVLEEKKEQGNTSPQFIFEVTMQNHSGYSPEYAGFTERIHLTDLTYSNTQTKAAEKYLTLIKYTDEALGELMTYFESVDEPTIVLMFGDHQPSDYVTNVIDRLTGYDPEKSLEEAQKSYLVPYFVWNNFGMDFDAPSLTSVNYLAADIMQAAQIPVTQYQQFLLALQEQLPVICQGAIVDSSGNYINVSDRNTLPEADTINDYNILQYNHMIDIRNRVTPVFAKPAGDAWAEIE